MLIRVVRVYISSSVLANLGQGETASQVRPKGQKISKKKETATCLHFSATYSLTASLRNIEPTVNYLNSPAFYILSLDGFCFLKLFPCCI